MRPRALFASAALLLASRLALAQSTGPSLDLRGFHAPTDPASGIYLEPADVPASGDWNASLWLSYAYRPITLRDASSGAIAFDVISHQVTSDVAVSVGLAHRLSLGFDLPVLLFQKGDIPDLRIRRVLGDTPLPAQALGDLGLDGKLALIRPTGGEFGGFALALHERFTLPTGDEASYLGEGAVTSETRFLAEYRLVAAGIYLAGGLKLRGSQERFACGDISDGRCPTRFGHQIPFGIGISIKPQIFNIDQEGHFTAYLEAHGHIPISPIGPFESTPASSLQASIGARYALRDVSFLAGVETALIGGVGDSPFRGILAVGWAPRVHDSDGDGIDDDVDQCLELPEDRDGFQDVDGCPDADNDDDGVPDKADKCPKEAEDLDNFQDEDGCADPDNDKDGIPDVKDACPNESGPANPDPKKNGCLIKDPDGDGIEGDNDKCPNQAEDKDGFQDADGCPDPDNDADGIPDAEDRCLNEKGILAEHGCPDPDPDKDTLQGQEDRCPSEPEVWNGIQDEDGCPDGAGSPVTIAGPGVAPKKQAKPLVSVKDAPKQGPGPGSPSKQGPSLEVAQAVKFTAANEVEAAQLSTLRAISAELLAHPGWTVSVGVRPSPKGGDAEARARAAAVVAAIRRFTRQEKAAVVAEWSAVSAAPRAPEFGIGFVLVTPEAAVAAPQTEPNKPPLTPKK